MFFLIITPFLFFGFDSNELTIYFAVSGIMIIFVEKCKK